MTKQKRGRLRGSPPELTVQILEDGVVMDKILYDSKVCRILGADIQNNLSWQSHTVTGKKAIFPAAKKQLGALYF